MMHSPQHAHGASNEHGQRVRPARPRRQCTRATEPGTEQLHGAHNECDRPTVPGHRTVACCWANRAHITVVATVGLAPRHVQRSKAQQRWPSPLSQHCAAHTHSKQPTNTAWSAWPAQCGTCIDRAAVTAHCSSTATRSMTQPTNCAQPRQCTVPCVDRCACPGCTQRAWSDQPACRAPPSQCAEASNGLSPSHGRDRGWSLHAPQDN